MPAATTDTRTQRGRRGRCQTEKGARTRGRAGIVEQGLGERVLRGVSVGQHTQQHSRLAMTTRGKPCCLQQALIRHRILHQRQHQTLHAGKQASRQTDTAINEPFDELEGGLPSCYNQVIKQHNKRAAMLCSGTDQCARGQSLVVDGAQPQQDVSTRRQRRLLSKLFQARLHAVPGRQAGDAPAGRQP
jgi:hypothetical protein